MIRHAVGMLVVVGVVTIGTPSSAHHSMVAYEEENTLTLQGVIHTVHWRSPHILVEVAVPIADGKTEIWTAEGGPVASAVRAGITPALLKVGTKVKIYGRRHRDHSKTLAILNAIEVDGKVYGRNA